MRRAGVLAAALLAAACSSAPERPAPPLLRADTADLRRTLVVAHPAEVLGEEAAGRNVLWCASFRLAFDALKRDAAKGPVAVEGTDPATAEAVRLLNASDFPPAALDPSSFVARAGTEGAAFAGALRAELRAKFGDGAPDPGLAPLPADGVHAFAYLRKDLPFALPFRTFPHPMTFAGGERPLASFGMSADFGDPRREEVLGQVTVLHETVLERGGRPESFVLAVDVGGGRDRLFLARHGDGRSLAEIWKQVTEYAGYGRPRRLGGTDVLRVPKLNLSLTHRFRGLLGRTVRWEGFSGPLVEARQVVDFRLDEGGARLESAAYLAAGALPRMYVLDGPFLLALMEKGASEPYLLLWIGNDELLAAAEAE